MIPFFVAVILAGIIGGLVAIIVLLEGNTQLYAILGYFGGLIGVILLVLKSLSGPGKDVLIPPGYTYRGQAGGPPPSRA